MAVIKKISFACGLFASVLAAPAAAATFIGDSFEGSYRFPHVGNATVQGGSTRVSPVGSFTFVTGRINPTANIFASSVEITFGGSGAYRAAEFNGILLRNLSRSNIAGLIFDQSTTLSGFDQGRLSFTSDSLLFNFAGLSINASDRVAANVLFVTSPVPEPATWSLMIIGLGAAGFAMRRRRERGSSVFKARHGRCLEASA